MKKGPIPANYKNRSQQVHTDMGVYWMTSATETLKLLVVSEVTDETDYLQLATKFFDNAVYEFKEARQSFLK